MDDIAPKVDALERQAKTLWLMLDHMADWLFVAQARGLALQKVLGERGLLDSADVTTCIAKMQQDAATDAELDQSPQAKAWRALRRAVEGVQPPPDDRT